MSERRMSVRGTLSEPRMTMGPRVTPLSMWPVQFVKVRPLRATAPVSGVVCEYQSVEWGGLGSVKVAG